MLSRPTNRLLVKEEVATYANTLYETAVAQGQDTVMEIRDQLEQVLNLYRGNSDLRDALDAPAYTAEQRGEMAKNVFDGLNPLLVSVFSVMAERGNFRELSLINSAYNDAVEERLGVSIVDVTTVVALDDELRTLITNKLSADLGKSVVLREHIDPSILGGIIMTNQGKRIDASVASKLDQARSVLREQNDGGEC